MNNKLTWQNIEDFLIGELKKTKHIMTWGTIGSLNIEHDIDTIITKLPSSPSAEFFKEVHIVFDKINIFLNKKYGFSVIRFAATTDENMIREFANTDKKVLFHTMIYVSFPQLKKDWAWGISPDENMDKIIKENYKPLKGKVEDLFSNEFKKENYCDNIFTYLYHYDNIHSGFKEKTIVNIMNPGLDYLFRKRLKAKYSKVDNLKNLKKRYYELCELADTVNNANPQ